MKTDDIVLPVALGIVAAFLFILVFIWNYTPDTSTVVTKSGYSNGSTTTNERENTDLGTDEDNSTNSGGSKRISNSSDEDFAPLNTPSDVDFTISRAASTTVTNNRDRIVYDDFDNICKDGDKLTVNRSGDYSPFGITMRARNGLAISGEGDIIDRKGKVTYSLKNGDCIDRYGNIKIGQYNK